MKNKIKVYYWGSLTEKDPLIILWKQIETELKKIGYQFKYYRNKSNNWEQIINDIHNEKYDIGIGSFYITSTRLKKVDFTYPISLIKSTIYYYQEYGIINQLLYFLQNTIPILIIILIISFILAFISFYVDQKQFFEKIYTTISGFLGQSGGILDITNYNNKTHIITNIIIIILIYYLTVTLFSIIIGKTFHHKEYINKSSIYKKKIIVSEGSEGISQIKKKGGIPIIVKSDSLWYYYNNKKEYDGIYTDNWNIYNMKTDEQGILKGKINNKKIELMNYNLDLGTFMIAFPLNKKNNTFIKDIKNIFLKKYIKYIPQLCEKVYNNHIFICKTLIE